MTHPLPQGGTDTETHPLPQVVLTERPTRYRRVVLTERPTRYRRVVLTKPGRDKPYNFAKSKDTRDDRSRFS